MLKDLYGSATEIRTGGYIQAGDLNKDGFPDVFVYSPRDTTGTLTRAGSVTVTSGLWLALGVGNRELFKLYGTISSGGFGHSLGYAGDANGDGYGDLLVGQPNKNLAPGGTTFLFSGKDGSLIYKFEGDSSGDNLGNRVSGVGDLNGDGVPDFIAGAMWDDNTATNAGSATVYSGKQLLLATDVHEFSLAKANTQKLSIDAGVAHQGRNYWALGSITGTSPGVSFYGVTIPLNPDPWTELTMAMTNTVAFSKTRGVLDSAGKAAATINLGPASVPSAIGLVMHHAYVVFDGSGRIHVASNPVPLRLEK